MLEEGAQSKKSDAHVNGQAPDHALKEFFALSRFSGAVTSKLSDLKKLNTFDKPKTVDSSGSPDKADGDAEEKVDGDADAEQSRGSKTWSKLRVGMAGKSVIRGLLAASKNEQTIAISSDEDENLTPEEQEARRKKQDLIAAKEAYIKARDVAGSTVLMAAAWNGNLGMVKMLLSFKANPNIVRPLLLLGCVCFCSVAGCMLIRHVLMCPCSTMLSASALSTAPSSEAMMTSLNSS